MASNIYTAALMEHNAHPDYKYDIQDADFEHEGINPSCGDEMVLKLKVADGVITEAAFTGHGCAVSQASADVMADLITGETVEEAKRLSGLFIGMIQGKELSDDDFACCLNPSGPFPRDGRRAVLRAAALLIMCALP